jgi:hypothetical protein
MYTRKKAAPGRAAGDVGILRLMRVLAILAAFAVVFGGCSLKSDSICCGACPDSRPAVFNLPCSATNLQRVVATGPCATPEASTASYMGNDAVFVRSQAPGLCHIELTFATGFTYSADITFASQPGGVCGGPQCTCPDYVAPTSGPVTIGSSMACADAGPGTFTD